MLVKRAMVSRRPPPDRPSFCTLNWLVRLGLVWVSLRVLIVKKRGRQLQFESSKAHLDVQSRSAFNGAGAGVADAVGEGVELETNEEGMRVTAEDDSDGAGVEMEEDDSDGVGVGVEAEDSDGVRVIVEFDDIHGLRVEDSNSDSDGVRVVVEDDDIALPSGQ